MRVLQVQIDSYKNLQPASIVPVSGLVVLFGANSVGKTNALEAVGSLLSPEPVEQRRELGDGHGPEASGRVLFELEQAQVPGHDDGRLFQRLVTGLLPEGEAAGLRGLAPQEVREYLCERLIEAGSGNDLDHKGRRLLARHLTDQSLFLWNGFATDWVAAADRLSRKAQAAARRLAATPGRDGDRLHRQASKIAAGADLVTLEATAQPYVEDADKGSFPEVVPLEPDPDGLEDQVRVDLDTLHHKLWQTESRPTAGTGAKGGDDPYFLEITDPVVLDPWLETQGDVRPHSTSLGLRWSSEDWCRVKPTLHSTARYLATEADRLAPGFVRDLGCIEVQVLPPTLWGKVPSRVRILFVEHDGERRELGTLGAGVARWIAASLRRAGRELRAAEREVLDGHGQVVEDVQAANRIIIGARGTAGDDLPLRLVRTPSDPLPLYVIDEPEAHLHPRAVQSVHRWLQELSRRVNANGVLVATHDESFFALSGDEARFLLVGRQAGKAMIRELDGDLWAQVGLLGEEVGCSRARLLQHTRLAVIVEGEQDAAALEAFFGEELARSLIRLIPVHGADHIRPIIKSQLLRDLSARQAVVRDKGRPETTRWLPRDVEVIELEQPDITRYLDSRACQTRAPRFPGWPAAKQEWNAARRPGKDLKDWCARQYGLRLDTRTVRELAAETRRCWGVPPELQRVLDQLKTLASTGSTPSG